MTHSSNIQLLRFVAASLVAGAHAMTVASGYQLPAGHPAVLLAGFGVDLFFVISGFIMVWTSADSAGRAHAAGTFVKRRIIRIVPLYWLITSLMVALLAFAPQLFHHLTLDPWHAAASYAFIPYPNPFGDAQPLVAVGWTLSYEMYFYFIFALALLLPTRSLVIAVSLYFLAAVWIGGAIEKTPVTDVLTGKLLLEFVFGCWVATAIRGGLTLAKPLSLIALIVCAAAPLMPGFADLYMSERALAGGILSALLLWAMVSLELRREFVSPPRLAALGDSTYALYLTHTLVIIGIYRLVGEGHAWSIPLAWFAAVIAAQIVYLFVEFPVTDFLKRRFAAKKAGARPASFVGAAEKA